MEQGRQKASLAHVVRSSTDESGGLLIVVAWVALSCSSAFREGSAVSPKANVR